MDARDFLTTIVAIAAFTLLSPFLLVLTLFHEPDPADSYKYRNC